MIHKQRLSTCLSFLAVFAIFSGALVVDRSVNSCFYILLLIAIARLIFKQGAAADFWTCCRYYWPICLAMSSVLLAVLIRQLVHGELSFRMYDLPARLATFALIFWSLLSMSPQFIKKMEWGFILGAMFYAADLYLDTNGGDFRINTINSFSIIFSSELAMLMGVFSVLSIGWNDSHKPWKIAMQIVAGLCGLYSVYLSQTRGAWIAIPLFIFISVSTLMHAQRTRIKAAVYIAIIVAIVALFSSTSIVHERVLEGTSDLNAFTDQKNLDTSVGVRLQLWNASWIMFKEHPLLGVGKENFSNELHVLHQRGIVTPMAAEQYHSHNEILYSMATMGVFGLLAILLTYFVPLFYFGKYMFHPDAQIHAAAAMGLSLCTGFIIFGTVDVMFGWNMCNVFYSCSIALFLAFIVTRAKEITV